ncbi:hypothetical protein L596_008869 [Steinernema carpocapsae]|uniref:Uncharacterized protein n=1 Tax=Steinernema carpocapsae TaxID=34508 RepID=A0A4U5PE19_STECR|nr:hypothetical protein L596_008869 [Steinernema carpocapsae]
MASLPTLSPSATRTTSTLAPEQRAKLRSRCFSCVSEQVLFFQRRQQCGKMWALWVSHFFKQKPRSENARSEKVIQPF